MSNDENDSSQAVSGSFFSSATGATDFRSLAASEFNEGKNLEAEEMFFIDLFIFFI